MKRITNSDLNKLVQLYQNRDYNSYKVVWSQLNKALEWIEFYGILKLSNSKTKDERLIQTSKELYNWIQTQFPDIFHELKRGKYSRLNDDRTFPKFKQEVINIDSLVENHFEFKLIKKLTIWGQEFKLKQTFHKIEHLERIDMPNNTFKFTLSNGAYLLITNEGRILNSTYNLTFENASYIELGFKGTKRRFELVTENKVMTLESSIDISSIYLKAMEIVK